MTKNTCLCPIQSCKKFVMTLPKQRKENGYFV